MAKHLLEDMVKTRHIKTEIKEVLPKEPIEILPIQKKNKSKYTLWFVALFSVIFFLFALSMLFSKADIVINPKIKDVVLNENLSANKDLNNDNLSFDWMVIPGEESRVIKTSGEKDVNLAATGTILIYNTFSSSPQSLNIDTRLEGSNGKIYKTSKKIVVPGMSKEGTPGQVEVGIYAAETGVEYNSGPLDFQIFGFKGSPKYSKFTGRSKTGTEIIGGFNGKVSDILDSEKLTVENDLRAALSAKLLQKATDHPSDVILFKDAVFINMADSSIPSKNIEDNSTTLTLKGTLYGILFNEQKLVMKITEDNVDKYDGSDVYIPNIKDLVFSLPSQISSFIKKDTLVSDITRIDFNLSGPSKIIWRPDINKFANDLLGKPKNDFKQILSQYGSIDSATLVLSPIWKMYLPDKIKDLSISVNYPK
ncbi:MAG: hypothetical protein WCP17_00260 [bacterium]